MPSHPYRDPPRVRVLIELDQTAYASLLRGLSVEHVRLSRTRGEEHHHLVVVNAERPALRLAKLIVEVKARRDALSIVDDAEKRRQLSLAVEDLESALLRIEHARGL